MTLLNREWYQTIARRRSRRLYEARPVAQLPWSNWTDYAGNSSPSPRRERYWCPPRRKRFSGAF
ncbi:hypothetical protein [Moorella stamsii]|uniref:hypothetical protein n=1 Tax=Neomoorella stamsii TaxID=1266720 RepID=UPI001AD93589|nr:MULTISPECIES: hypothetical protein [Moorella]